MTTNELVCKCLENEEEVDALVVKFVTAFYEIYEDKGSGAGKNGSFWRPKVPEGFFAVGDLAIDGYYDPTNTQSMAVVKPAPNANPTNPSLKSPVDYIEIWNDKGSGGKYDGSVWQPVAPQGYKALGTVVVNGYYKPSLDLIRCVREDLTETGEIGDSPWNDEGSGANKDIKVWGTRPMMMADRFMRLPANSFMACNNYYKPNAHPVNNVLKLIMPVAKEQVANLSVDERMNKLQSLGIPTTGNETVWLVIQKTLVPYVVITDKVKDEREKAEKYPFYILERSEAWKCLDVLTNRTGKDSLFKFSKKVGWSKEEKQRFETKVGAKLGYEVGGGVNIDGFSASSKFSFELSWEFGFSEESSFQETEEQTIEGEMIIQAGETGARWARMIRLRILRAPSDAELVAETVMSTKDTLLITYPSSTKSFVPAKLSF